MTRKVVGAAEEVYAAVRLDRVAGAEFVDLGTVSCHRDGAQQRAKEAPHGWREANPVKRIGKFRLEEMPR